ncbi:MAG: VWA domain-containing protein, partial [Pseudomonadota bacterium]
MWLGAVALGASVFPASAQVETYDAVSPSSRIMFVFDGSNSMWAPVDGGRKIDVARNAFATAIDAVPATTELGLTIYGHRSRGDCSDIEVAVPMTSGLSVRSRMSDSVAAVRPKGKTPLSNAVRKAAESMKYQEVPATIVLITDGVESCGADPCSLAQDLEELGVDFKAHVIGFDLSGEEQDALVCMAEQTGGTFFSAQDSTSLEQAFEQLMVVETAAPAADEPASVPQQISVWVESVRQAGKPLPLRSEGAPGNDE